MNIGTHIQPLGSLLKIRPVDLEIDRAIVYVSVDLKIQITRRLKITLLNPKLNKPIKIRAPMSNRELKLCWIGSTTKNLTGHPFKVHFSATSRPRQNTSYSLLESKLPESMHELPKPEVPGPKFG